MRSVVDRNIVMRRIPVYRDSCDMKWLKYYIALLPTPVVLASSVCCAQFVAWPDKIDGSSANQVNFLLSLGNLNERSCVPKLLTPNPIAHQLKKFIHSFTCVNFKFLSSVSMNSLYRQDIKISHISRRHCAGCSRVREVRVVPCGWLASTVYSNHNGLDR